MSVGHYLELPGARVIQTVELLLAGRAVRDLLAAGAMGVLHGPAGSGKTFAALVALEELRVATAWVQFPSRPSMLHVARRLYRELAGADPRRANRFDLSEDLIALLAARERLLIVDEAQWLNRECIEYLRHLHDHPETRFALLLIGGDGCWEVLSREPMLRSRIYRRVRFTRMPLQTVLEVIPAYHPLYHDAAPDLMALVDDRYAHGCFREWASFTHSALALCHERHVPELTEGIARAVLELHAGGSVDEAA
ncbi:MAG: AAA family ATPase [Solirubrobacteraceae bacterium]